MPRCFCLEFPYSHIVWVNLSIFSTKSSNSMMPLTMVTTSTNSSVYWKDLITTSLSTSISRKRLNNISTIYGPTTKTQPYKQKRIWKYLSRFLKIPETCCTTSSYSMVSSSAIRNTSHLLRNIVMFSITFIVGRISHIGTL